MGQEIFQRQQARNITDFAGLLKGNRVLESGAAGPALHDAGTESCALIQAQGFAYEPVLLPFLTERSRIAVATQQTGGVRQSHNAANGGFQLTVVREIG